MYNTISSRPALLAGSTSLVQLQDIDNWTVSENLVAFTTSRRAVIKEKCHPFIENISIIPRKLLDDKVPKEYFEGRLTLHLKYHYIHLTTLSQIRKLIKDYISEEAAKTLSDYVTYAIPNTEKNHLNQLQMKSTKLFFQTPYPTGAEELVTRLCQFQEMVLEHPNAGNFIHRYHWHTFQTNGLPYKYRITIPNIAVLVGTDIRDAIFK